MQHVHICGIIITNFSNITNDDTYPYSIIFANTKIFAIFCKF